MADIDFNYAPIMNIYMNSTRGYLPGWSASWGDVWHYVPGFGYGAFGWKAHVTDHSYRR